jgi:hypothetical protein
LRSPDGKLARRIGRFAYTAYDPRAQRVVAITFSRQLVRTDGRTTETLRSLGSGRHPRVEVLPSGLIKVGFEDRLLLLEPDGKVFAASPAHNVVSNIFMLPHRRGVVFVAQRRSVDRVLLLERGAHSPRILYRQRTGPRGCAYWANLSLVGDDVLYWPSTGRRLVAIKPEGDTTARDLSPLLHRLPGFRHEGRIFRAAWAPAWNR